MTTGTAPIEAVLFDTFGTVCDFYHPLKRAIDAFATQCGVHCDAGAMAIEWRTAYIVSTYTQGTVGGEFLPLWRINRDNLMQVLARHGPFAAKESDIDELNRTWERLEPWPDVVEGLQRIRNLAIVAPLSNGNFADMVRLSRFASLPWDIILGSSISGHYKPHPETYLKSVEALGLEPEQVCMVAAHQRDLVFAAGHGMQTAFVRRPNEFGGPVKPAEPEPGVNYMAAAEIHLEGDWDFVADDFLDLATQLERLDSR